MRLLIIALLAAVCLSSCKKEVVKSNLPGSDTQVLIANEGNFGWGNGTLSVYEPNSSSVSNDVFYHLNGIQLGNVFQSINRINGDFYFVLNNSAEIWVTDSNYILIAKISGFSSPRNIYQISGSKAYVTDLYANKIWVVDLKSKQITGSIKVSGWMESGLVVKNNFIVGCMENENLYKINTANDLITDSFKVNYAIESMEINKEGQLWVLSQGNSKDINPGLYLLSVEFDTIYKSIPLSNLPAHLKYDPSLDRLYFLNKEIYHLNVKTASSPSVFVQLNSSTPYSIGLDRNTGDIYVSDVHDYVSASTIYRYNKEGDLTDQFKAGIISGAFYFR